jgi:hypothetical protein
MIKAGLGCAKLYQIYLKELLRYLNTVTLKWVFKIIAILKERKGQFMKSFCIPHKK